MIRYIRRRLRSTQLKFYVCHFKAHSNSLQSGSHSLIFGSSRYSYLLDWRQENSSVERLGIIGYMTRLISTPRRPASFFAYFRPDFPEILRLICCHTHLTKAVKQDLEKRDITYVDGSSMQDMIPGEDKAFVFVSGGICSFDDEDVNDIFLRLSFFINTSHTNSRTWSAHTNSAPHPIPT